MGKPRLASAAGAFGAAKGAAFAAPIFLAAALAPDAYGRFEGALALGQSLAPWLGMGLPAALPYFVLEKRKASLGTLFRTHMGLLLLGGIIAGAVLAALGAWYGAAAALFASLVPAQILAGAAAKVADRPARAAVYEGAWQATLFAVALVLVVFRGGEAPFSRAVVPLWIVASVLLLTAPGGRCRISLTYLGRAYRRVLPFATRALMASLLLIPLVTFVRLTGGLLFSSGELARYGITFRVLAVAMAIPQFSVVFMFRRLYSGTGRRLSADLALIVAATASVAFAAAAVLLNVELDGAPLPELLLVATSMDRRVFWLVACQITAWCGLTLVEMQMLRAGRGLHLAGACGFGLVAAIGVLLAGAAAGRWHFDLLVCGATVGLVSATALSAWWLRRDRIDVAMVGGMCGAAGFASLALLWYSGG